MANKGEIKKRMADKLKKHKEDVRMKREGNADKHCQEANHEIVREEQKWQIKKAGQW